MISEPVLSETDIIEIYRCYRDNFLSIQILNSQIQNIQIQNSQIQELFLLNFYKKREKKNTVFIYYYLNLKQEKVTYF